MSENKALVSFDEVSITWSDLASLSSDQKAAWSIICFADSEIKALMTLCLFTQKELTGSEGVDSAILAQMSVLLRTWSAKLFEFTEFLTFRKWWNKTSDQELLRIGTLAIEKFGPLKNGQGYEIASGLRNETASHYSLSATRDNLEFVAANSKYTLISNGTYGNTVCSIGEDIVVRALLDRVASVQTKAVEMQEIVNAWLDWNLAATRWAQEFHGDFESTFIAPLIIGKIPRRRTYWIDPNLIGSSDDTTVPVFLRKAD